MSFNLIRQINPENVVSDDWTLENAKQVSVGTFVKIHDYVYKVTEKNPYEEVGSDYVSTELKLEGVMGGKPFYIEWSDEDYGIETWVTTSRLSSSEMQSLTYDCGQERIKQKFDWWEEIADKQWTIMFKGVSYYYEDDWGTEDVMFFDFANYDKSLSVEYWKADESFEASLSTKLSNNNLRIVSYG